MTDTGRVVQPLGRRTQRLIFGTYGSGKIVEELGRITTVGLAHVVMLVNQGLMAKDTGVSLLRAITRLRSEQFRELYNLLAPRDLYPVYDGYLMRVLGAEVSGTPHTDRSRNDLKATTQAMPLWDWLLGFLDDRTYRALVIPSYAHFQATLPYSYPMLGIDEPFADPRLVHLRAQR
jgi:argininosuccinate lyase